MPGLNFYAMSLARLDMAFDEPAIRGSLTPFSQAITRMNAIIDMAAIKKDEIYLDFFLDDDLDLIETHLGGAFITCQVFLTVVVSRIKALHRYNQSQGAAPFTMTTDRKRDILASASASVASTRYTQMHVIDAFANYFKHRDEWNATWSTVGGQSADTVAVITSVGAQEGSTGNLRTGAEALGNKSYEDVDGFATLIVNWKDSLCVGYRAELTARGLLSQR